MSSSKHSVRHPLAKLALKLRSTNKSQDLPKGLDGLADAIEDLEAETNDQLVRDALHLFREFLAQAWDQLPRDHREKVIATATQELEGLAQHMEESTLAAMIEEVARDRLRQQYPLLCSSALWETLQAQPHSPNESQ